MQPLDLDPGEALLHEGDPAPLRGAAARAWPTSSRPRCSGSPARPRSAEGWSVLELTERAPAGEDPFAWMRERAGRALDAAERVRDDGRADRQVAGQRGRRPGRRARPARGLAHAAPRPARRGGGARGRPPRPRCIVGSPADPTLGRGRACPSARPRGARARRPRPLAPGGGRPGGLARGAARGDRARGGLYRELGLRRQPPDSRCSRRWCWRPRRRLPPARPSPHGYGLGSPTGRSSTPCGSARALRPRSPVSWLDVVDIRRSRHRGPRSPRSRRGGRGRDRVLGAPPRRGSADWIAKVGAFVDELSPLVNAWSPATSQLRRGGGLGGDGWHHAGQPGPRATATARGDGRYRRAEGFRPAPPMTSALTTARRLRRRSRDGTRCAPWPWRAAGSDRGDYLRQPGAGGQLGTALAWHPTTGPPARHHQHRRHRRRGPGCRSGLPRSGPRTDAGEASSTPARPTARHGGRYWPGLAARGAPHGCVTTGWDTRARDGAPGRGARLTARRSNRLRRVAGARRPRPDGRAATPAGRLETAGRRGWRRGGGTEARAWARRASLNEEM